MNANKQQQRVEVAYVKITEKLQEKYNGRKIDNIKTCNRLVVD